MENVPRAVEEYRKYLDEGITLHKDKAIITLDYSRIFRKDKMEGATKDMTLFQALADSPFKDLIEHPLCQCYLHNKFRKVIWFFVLILLFPHFFFSGNQYSTSTARCKLQCLAVFSVYSGLLFGYLCAPPKDAQPEERWDFNQEIECKRVVRDKDLNSVDVFTRFSTHAIYTTWVFLMMTLVIYLGREAVSLSVLQHKYFCKWDGYRNISIIISIILVVFKGPPTKEGLKLMRWQHHVASITCLLLWLEMLMLVGKIPKFGKYIHMFK